MNTYIKVKLECGPKGTTNRIESNHIMDGLSVELNDKVVIENDNGLFVAKVIEIINTINEVDYSPIISKIDMSHHNKREHDKRIAELKLQLIDAKQAEAVTDVMSEDISNNIDKIEAKIIELGGELNA